MNQDRSPQTKPNKATFIRRRIGVGLTALLTAAGVTAGVYAGEAHGSKDVDSVATKPNSAPPAPQHALTEGEFMAKFAKNGEQAVQQRQVYGKGTKIYTGPIDNTGHAPGVEITEGEYDVTTPIIVTDPATGIEYSVFKGNELTTTDPTSTNAADKFFWIADRMTPPLSSEYIDNGKVVTVNLDKQGDPTSTGAVTVATGNFTGDYQLNRLR